MTTSITTTKEQNIQRAMDSTRLIGGQVHSLTKANGGSWTLVVDQNTSRYQISIWDNDQAHTDAALSMRPGDIVTLQVHAYHHPAYNPWKIWDVLQFSDSEQRLVTRLNDEIKANTRASLAQHQQAQIELRRIGDLRQAMAVQKAERENVDFWRQVAGVGSAVACLAAAVPTGGLSLCGLGGSAVMLTSSSSSSSAFADVQLQHRREDLGRSWRLMQQQAIQGLQCIDALEGTLERAKLQPWKTASHGISYGLLPTELRQQLNSIATSAPPAGVVTIDASVASSPYALI